jgi:two-component system chemotaxis response regulator CheB
VRIKKKIKVLVVDDSLLFRETIAKKLAEDPTLEVVGKAPDAFRARDLIEETEPDVMTLDVEMPKMNGIEFLRKLMPQYPLPVVVVSAVSKNVFDALDAGAVDFVTKPDTANGRSFDTLITELIIKVKIASTANVGHWKRAAAFETPLAQQNGGNQSSIIAFGASTGGTEAIASILRVLPKNMPGIVMVQHMPPVFTRFYAERLNNNCLLEVCEASDGDMVLPGRVLLAPGDYQMELKKSGNRFTVKCFKGEKVSGHCPSVDVLFHSVAAVIARNSIGVILTGMGSDGAKGLLAMRRGGALTIGQNEESCVVYGMPKVAYDLGAVEYQTSLEKIPQLLCSLTNRNQVSSGQ